METLADKRFFACVDHTAGNPWRPPMPELGYRAATPTTST